MKLATGALLLILAMSGTARAEPLPGASVESLLAAAREHSPDVRMVRLRSRGSARTHPAGRRPARPGIAHRAGKHHEERQPECDAPTQREPATPNTR